MMPSGGSMPGDSAFEGARPIADRKPDHREIDGGGGKIGAGKGDNGHPR